ncbi:hypothetical protein [Microbacterium telephonicum]|uniref:Glycine zipper-like domain-containing protein n=1 Tax=Microbacterium telephonicum TaxID=1714841 RepID=A0A498CBZ5_9MICO|nr:hypothetical protein [Microbacterium telephonicum]RLK49711.1 hypothetical protein C7474_1872 [Microbacterium telephonicum]
MDEGEKDDAQQRRERSQATAWGIGIALGLAIGTSLGVALGNIGIGIALGVGIGMAFAVAFGAVTSDSRGADSDGANTADQERDGKADPDPG